jgi:hypothetical protein
VVAGTTFDVELAVAAGLGVAANDVEVLAVDGVAEPVAAGVAGGFATHPLNNAAAATSAATTRVTFVLELGQPAAAREVSAFICKRQTRTAKPSRRTLAGTRRALRPIQIR